MRNRSRGTLALTLGAVVLWAVWPLTHETSVAGGTPLAEPTITRINGASAPTATAGDPIELSGAGFKSGPATVIFAQGDIVATAVPASTIQTDSSLVVYVPTGSIVAPFSLPGDVTVTVEVGSVTSNSLTLAVGPPSSFYMNMAAWTITAPLPVPLTGLRAVAVPASNGAAYVIVTGGFNGRINTDWVFSDALNLDGTVGQNWSTIRAAQLPVTVAHHGMVEADASNSAVPAGVAYIYVIGGQVLAGGQPGGLATVYMASVSVSTGAVGPWTALAGSSLPQTLVGPTVTLYHGWIYVIGGLLPNGAPSANVYSALVTPDGTLGPWVSSGSVYPHGISFATAFGFAGSLFVVDGDTANSDDPNAVGSLTGSDEIYYARALNGIVGTWGLSPTPTPAGRKKHVTWQALGQTINGEGIRQTLPGVLELEWSLFSTPITLNDWLPMINLPGANVYNAAAVTSPSLSSRGTPRFLLLGGQRFDTGQLSGQVYYNDAP